MIPTFAKYALFAAGAGAAAALVATVAYRLGRRHATHPSDLPRVRDVIRRLNADFTVTTSELFDIVNHMVDEMKKGLTDTGSSMMMLVSHVTQLPRGDEEGQFYALDLGGSNFRVLRITIDGKGKCTTESKKYQNSEAAMTGTGDMLFGFIADCVREFAPETVNAPVSRPLGFTFSFGVQQSRLDSGVLLGWSKGFSATGVVGEDVVALLQKAFFEKGINLKIVALINDTVGTLMTAAIEDHNTYMGVILGTGTNACYWEDVREVQKWKDRPESGHVIINSEWGNFDSQKEVLPTTSYDHMLDASSLNAGRQIYEKMISGMYLGEIVRLVVLDLAVSGKIFDGRTSDKLRMQWGFKTSFMSDVESDSKDFDLELTGTIISREMGIFNPTLADRYIVRKICTLVSTRAARLAAAAVVAVLRKMNRLHSCTVGVDGSVFQFYPHFEERMRATMDELIQGGSRGIVFKRSEDGSGKGAALVAATAVRSVEESDKKQKRKHH